jgi:hypothetical protein
LVRKDADRREVEQVANTTARRLVRKDQDCREVEQVADTAARRLVREDPVQRQVEQISDTVARRIVRVTVVEGGSIAAGSLESSFVGISSSRVVSCAAGFREYGLGAGRSNRGGVEPSSGISGGGRMLA